MLQHVAASLGKGFRISLLWRYELLGREKWAQYRAIFYAFSMALGAILYLLLWFEPAPLASLISVLICAALAFGLTHWVGTYSVLALSSRLILAVSVGLLAGHVANWRSHGPRLEGVVGPVMVEGWVTAIDPAARGDRLRLAVHAIQGVSADQRPHSIRLTHISARRVDVGRFVRCWSVVRPPPGPLLANDYAFDRQAYFEGLRGVGYVQGRCRGGVLGPPRDAFTALQLRIAQMRRALARYVYHHAGGADAHHGGGFAAALVSGDRSFMSSEVQQALRGSGLAHLMAISGLHMGLLSGLAYVFVWRSLVLIEPLALRIPVRKLAAAAAIMAGLAYLIISGGSVSTQRAFIMALIFYAAILFDRRALSMQSCALAMMLIVFWMPWSVLTPGFQMSFAATGALIATYEVWRRRRRLADLKPAGFGFWLKSLFVTSVVSTLATLPFGLFHFGRVAEHSVVANLLAMPIFTLFSAPVAMSSLLFLPFGLSDEVLKIFGFSLMAVVTVADWFSPDVEAAQSSFKPMTGLSLFCLTISLGWAFISQGVWRYLATLPLLFGLLMWLFAPAAGLVWAPSGDVLLIAENGRAERLQVSKGSGLMPMRYRNVERQSLCLAPSCQYSVGASSIAIITRPDAVQCADLQHVTLVLADVTRPQHLDCNLPWFSWQDVPERAGLQWRLHKGTLRKIASPACGRRPWRPCYRN